MDRDRIDHLKEARARAFHSLALTRHALDAAASDDDPSTPLVEGAIKDLCVLIAKLDQVIADEEGGE